MRISKLLKNKGGKRMDNNKKSEAKLITDALNLDLCKLFRVEEGEEFKIEYNDTVKDALTFKIIQNNLYGRLSKDDMYKLSSLGINSIKRIKNIIKLSQKKEFSQNTLNFFKCIDKRYKYLAKDKSGIVCAFCEKPTKKVSCWFYDRCHITKLFNQDMFDQIKWEDEEPVFIDDYVER